jgi:5-methylcytosine-specific restriction endonuclease McrA
MAIDEKRKPFIIATLRRASYRWNPRYLCKINARVERGKYRCAKCKEVFGPKAIAVDHIIPVVPVTGFDDWNGYIDRLFCAEEGFQVLCKQKCHSEKSRNENALRKENKNAGKTIKKSSKRKLR